MPAIITIEELAHSDTPNAILIDCQPSTRIHLEKRNGDTFISFPFGSKFNIINDGRTIVVYDKKRSSLMKAEMIYAKPPIRVDGPRVNMNIDSDTIVIAINFFLQQHEKNEDTRNPWIAWINEDKDYIHISEVWEARAGDSMNMLYVGCIKLKSMAERDTMFSWIPAERKQQEGINYIGQG